MSGWVGFGGESWVTLRPSGRGAPTSRRLSGALGGLASLPTAVVLLAESNQAFWPDVGRRSGAQSYFKSPESYKGQPVRYTLQK